MRSKTYPGLKQKAKTDDPMLPIFGEQPRASGNQTRQITG